MSNEPIAINRYLGTGGVDEMSKVISSAYKCFEDSKGVPLPDGLTAWGVADAILDTLNGYASSGFNVDASELVGFICTAIEQLAGESSDAPREPAGFVVVDIKTRKMDWDGELHLTREAALESLTGPRQMWCRTPEEATDERTYYGDVYEILTVTP